MKADPHFWEKAGYLQLLQSLKLHVASYVKQFFLSFDSLEE